MITISQLSSHLCSKVNLNEDSKMGIYFSDKWLCSQSPMCFWCRHLSQYVPIISCLRILQARDGTGGGREVPTGSGWSEPPDNIWSPMIYDTYQKLILWQGQLWEILMLYCHLLVKMCFVIYLHVFWVSIKRILEKLNPCQISNPMLSMATNMDRIVYNSCKIFQRCACICMSIYITEYCSESVRV